MENQIETIKYRGHDIEVFYDQDYMSPDDWGDDGIFIVHEHRSFTIRREGFVPLEIFNEYEKGKKLYKKYWIIPLYAYIHSGVSLSIKRTGQYADRWDSSFAGFVLIKRQTGWWTFDEAWSAAEQFVEEWNLCLSGEVYCYNSEAGSCFGFYGDEGKEDMIKEAKDEIDFKIQKDIDEHCTYLKRAIKYKIPISYRKALTI